MLQKLAPESPLGSAKMTSDLQSHIPESEAPHLNKQVRAGNQEVWVGQDMQPLEALWLPLVITAAGSLPVAPYDGASLPSPPTSWA